VSPWVMCVGCLLAIIETNQRFIAECILGWICDSIITIFVRRVANSRVFGLFFQPVAYLTESCGGGNQAACAVPVKKYW
jgi:hypothetical protein